MTRLKIAIVIVFVALAGFVVWQAAKPSDEPVYHGRTLTSWLRSYWDTNLLWDTNLAAPKRVTNPEAVEAIRQMGTNAIPTLLRLLRLKDSSFKLGLMKLVQRQHVIHVRFTPASDWNDLAGLGFYTVGTNAQSATPEIVQIINQNVSPVSQSRAMECFLYIGPPAKQAVPCLLQWATNATATNQILARFLLYSIDREAATKAGITNFP